ncbi:MAG: hypothetical protein WBB34_15195 [Xanthobacteraceae bacterium]
MNVLKGTDIKYGTTQHREYLHMTGGLLGVKAKGGWLIGPLPGEAGPRHIGPIFDAQIAGACQRLGTSVFGADEVSETDPLLPSRVWTPILGIPRLEHQPADTWAWVEHAARIAGDDDYAALAQNISVTLRAAGIRLRDASDQYHRQLVAALNRKKPPGRFQNIPMTDLHLAFHSLLAELASARDYLASIAGNHVSAPASIDALSRLTAWIKKPARSASHEPLIAALLDACDETKPNPWLDDLSSYRNMFLHNEPLGTNEHARWLSLVETTTILGKVMLIEMQIPVRSGLSQTCEALRRFVDLHARMYRLADFGAQNAKYKPRVPHVQIANRA